MFDPFKKNQIQYRVSQKNESLCLWTLNYVHVAMQLFKNNSGKIWGLRQIK